MNDTASSETPRWIGSHSGGIETPLPYEEGFHMELVRKVAKQSIRFRSHDGIHLDEIVALWLIKQFAGPEWLAKHCPDNTINLGIDGGEFDEHGSPDEPSKNEDCCATLVAKSLGVRFYPELKMIMDYTVNHDLGGVSHPFDLGSTIKALHLKYPHRSDIVVRWALHALDAKYLEQVEYLNALKVVTKAQPITVEKNGRTVKILAIESDNAQVIKAVRSPEIRAMVTIQRRSSGNVQVFTDRKQGIDLSQVIAMLRYTEHELRYGSKLSVDDTVGEGTHQLVPEWNYFKRGEMIFNGSLTNRDVQPTVIPFNRIVQIVRSMVRIKTPALSGARPTTTVRR